jgi:hypothetical protein
VNPRDPGESITDASIEDFLDRLASRDPTPGGGSAAAIMGAMGAALVSMVCNVSFGKKGYDSVEPELREVCSQSEALRKRLTGMVAEDVAAFDELMAAYKLPKDTEEQKAQRSQAIQASLKRATEVPLACARDCAEVVRLSQRAGRLCGRTQRRAQRVHQCAVAQGSGIRGAGARRARRDHDLLYGRERGGIRAGARKTVVSLVLPLA